MKKQFKTRECENIMEKFLEWHDATCISMYQPIKYRHILVVEVVATSGTEIDKMQQMNLNVSLYAENYHIQMWLSKH